MPEDRIKIINMPGYSAPSSERKGTDMRTIVLFIAMSLDGYIADPAGGVDWLSGQDDSAEDAGPYPAFIRGVDTIIMGYHTWNQITTELSPEEWIYPGQKSYVITHKALPSSETVTFTSEDPCSLVRRLAGEDGKAIWICGGAEIIRQLMKEHMINRYHISVIPTILGNGIRLFSPMEREVKLRLIRAQTWNGITDLIYEPRFSPQPSFLSGTPLASYGKTAGRRG